MADHRPFGLTGGARGVAENRQIISASLRHSSLEHFRLFRIKSLPQLLNRLETHQPRVRIIPQAFCVPVDHAADGRHIGADSQQLVALLLIFGKDEHRVGMFNDIFDLGRGAVGENAHCHAAACLNRQLGPKVLRIVVADDADFLPAL